MSRWSLLGGAIACVIAGACASIAGLDDPQEIPDAGGGSIDAPIDPSEGGPPSDGSSDSKLDASTPCDEPGLVARWKLEEGAGLRIFDCTSGAHHGELVNGPIWVDGPTGHKAVGFDAAVVGNRIDIGDAGDDAAAFEITGAMTLAVWIRAFNGSGRLLTKSGTTGDRGWDLTMQPDASIEFRVATAPDLYTSTITGGIELDQWKHVVAVFDPGNKMAIYVDGQSMTELTTDVPDAQRIADAGVVLGARSDCCSFDGLIDDARLYNRVLTSSEIDALFKAK